MLRDYFRDFVKERNIKESTVKGYESALKKYVFFYEESIGELLNEAMVDESEVIPLKERMIKKRLLDYRTYLLESDMSPNTARTYFQN